MTSNIDHPKNNHCREIKDIRCRNLVSVVIRTKDRPLLLQRAIASIAAQTYRPVEVVMVNDGGSPVACDELKNILGDISLTYVALDKGRGRAGAANEGLGHAKGEYIGFLDDDDEFYPDHLSVIVSLLKESGHKVAYGAVEFTNRIWDSEGRTVHSEVKHIFGRDFSGDDLIIANYIPLMSLVFDADLLKSLRFDESFDLYEDWDLLIRAAEKTTFCYINKVTAIYNQWGDSQIAFWSSPEIIQQATLKIYRKHQMYITPAIVFQMREERQEKDRIIAELNGHIRELNRKIERLTVNSTKPSNL